MKRLTCFFLILALAFILNGLNSAVAKEHKVDICHVTHVDEDGNRWGHVINISRNALCSHLKNHGDSTRYKARKDGTCLAIGKEICK